MMDYKGYIGVVEFDDEAGIFHGEVVNTRDVITFQGKTVAEIKMAFRESVNDYLQFCKKRGEEPDKPFSGKLVLRMEPALHRALAIAARRERKSLNSLIVEKLEQDARGSRQSREQACACPPSSNRACGFPAHGFPMFFMPRHALSASPQRWEV